MRCLMYFKKTLVLSALDDTALKAVVNIERFKDSLEGQVRLYNFKQEPNGILSLGILKNGQVLKAGLTKKDSKLYTFVIEDESSIEKLEEGKNITCALINFVGGDARPILYGSTDGKFPTQNEIKLASALCVLDEKPSIEKTEAVLDELEIDYDDQEKAEIEAAIDKEMNQCERDCSTCKYRQAFFTNEQQTVQEEEKAIGFFDEVKQQINELFESYPEEDFLKQIIPNSKWVRVDYEGKGEYYVVGLIYEEGDLKYICYGVPGLYQAKPPVELEGIAQWLPLDTEKPEDYGYWISYQDANSGENIQMEII